MNRVGLAILVILGGKIFLDIPFAFTALVAFWIGTWTWLDRIGQKTEQKP